MQAAIETVEHQNFVREALDNFEVLIDDLDYAAFYELMGIGRLQFLRHKQMHVELKSMHIALWRLALSHSFPEDAESMFSVFLQRYQRTHPGKLDSEIVGRAPGYWDMILPTGNSDFSGVARHLLSFSNTGNADMRALILKVALRINAAYNLIFDRLV